MNDVKNFIKVLRDRLRNWEYLYYVENDSVVSDEEYDYHMEALRILEMKYPDLITIDSPTNRIGGKLKSGFCQFHHTIPMLSLDSIFDESSLLNFDKRVRKRLQYKDDQEICYCCELKIDGVGVHLVYKNGILISASTRGDGHIGEDVTDNVRTIRAIPLFLRKDKFFPELLEVRGEVFMSNDAFLKLNKLFIQSGVKTFSNPRNAAAGSLRQLNSSVTHERSLDFFCYHLVSVVLSDDKMSLSDSHYNRLQQCAIWGLPILRRYNQICTGIHAVLQYYKQVQQDRELLGFNIDGIVIKVDSICSQNNLSVSLRAPRWAIGYKFSAKRFVARICDIRFQVSRMGVLIPVASIIPIVISGVVIRSVNLHNIDFIRRLDLMIGDFVIIQRIGDVIPKIIHVVFSKRIFHECRPIMYPENCPVCSSVLYQICCKKRVILRCNAGLNCFAQRKEILKHFVSRKAMNIVGMGDKIIDRLIKVGLLSTQVDFFKLKIENLVSVDGVKFDLANRLLHAIEISKKTTLSRFIYALGIPNVGECTANILAKHYGTLECLISAEIISLLAIRNIGDIVAYNVFNFFRNNHNICIVNELLSSDFGVRFMDG
ncbi:NAD-dependent DNA ligase LigA [Blochmannia endosymbiont of Polyrhachis (Hedomyrma) turneri]|uniref:NAD-dependent DNA ligase LigA n=1 Tax=Blochmannia endosymbiont of Polyrhachis (Hedomyrma) turneri TaxID=1505596 RepID=UPI00061A5F4C|nr:NAD-dependent DNA ligase LigA [Blochmannia endosymbiont of Polyrhachis (Hedomyrma) turneri]AKC60067.1 DNA ligase [Blochmannia endosymbiont of Polyrhachis (Hedomyrma) turneri]